MQGDRSDLPNTFLSEQLFTFIDPSNLGLGNALSFGYKEVQITRIEGEISLFEKTSPESHLDPNSIYILTKP